MIYVNLIYIGRRNVLYLSDDLTKNSRIRLVVLASFTEL